MFVANRTKARKIGNILNAIAGNKRVVQARTKTDKGWPIPYKAGTLKMPKGCTIRQRKKFLQKGIDFGPANCHSVAD